MRRLVLAVVLVSGCGEISVDDVSESTKPNRAEFCTYQAHITSADGYFDQAIYDRCLRGSVTASDGGRD